MMQLSSTHIDNCTREINRWSKAVRLIHSLERNLPPDGFPEPDLIEPFRKPFDLRLVWQTDSPEYSAKLRKRISSGLKLGLKWCLEVDGYYSLCTRLRLGERTTMYLQLIVADGYNPSVVR